MTTGTSHCHLAVRLNQFAQKPDLLAGTVWRIPKRRLAENFGFSSLQKRINTG
jgi:hypothetical protein